MTSTRPSAPDRKRPAPAPFADGNLSLSSALFAMNVAIFVALVMVALFREREGLLETEQLWRKLVLGYPISVDSLAFGALSGRGVLQAQEWWRLVNYQFLHANLLHLLFNMMTLRSLGVVVELNFGSARFLWIYLMSGVGAGLCSLFGHVLVEGQIQFATVGASGALCGLVGALFVFGRRRGGAANWLGQTLLLNTVGLVMLGLMYQAFDNWAHVGGLVSGMALAWPFATSGTSPRGRARVRFAALCLILGAAAALILGAARVVEQRVPGDASGTLNQSVLHWENLMRRIQFKVAQFDRTEKAEHGREVGQLAAEFSTLARVDAERAGEVESCVESLDLLATLLRRGADDSEILRQVNAVSERVTALVRAR